MSKIKILILIVIVFTLGCQDSYVGSIANYPIGAEITAYDQEGLEKVIVRDLNGSIISEGDFLDGVNHGVWIEYDDKGAPLSIKSYFMGSLQGVTLEFENGAMISRSSYKNNQLNGLTMTFNNRGKLSEVNYVNGVIHGINKKFYQGGTLMEEANYVNGVIDGLAKWYGEDGTLSFQYLYQNGKLVDQNPEVE